MKTIFTSLPIYDKLAKQCYERGKQQESDSPVPIICPRHRLPSFQWLDDSDGATSVAAISMIKKGYTGSETALVTTWASHTFDDTFTHTGLNITQGKNVGAGLYQCNTDAFIGNVGDIIHIQGTMAGYTGTYPVLYLENNAGVQYYLTDGAFDIDIIVKYPGSNKVYISGVGAVDFSFSVSITKYDDITSLYWYFPTLPALSVDRFTYEGDTLNYLLATGLYYLKIETNNYYVYYSDWFLVDCVYPNLISSFVNTDYDTLTTSGTAILSAIDGGVNADMLSGETFSVIKGEVIKVILYLTNIIQLPYINITSTSLGVVSNAPQLAAGLNVVSLTCTRTGSDMKISIYNTTAANFWASEVMVNRIYSEKYLTLNYSNSCDIGDILYADGLTQTVWFESEAMEPSFPQEEQGVNNGDGRFVRSFARQVKKYVARTKEMPAFMADVFYRMRLHDTVDFIDLVGDENDVYNLEVEHEWLGDDKYYAQFNLTFDFNEAFVVAGCCNNLT